MVNAHRISVRVFSYENRGDNNEIILKKLVQLFPFNLEDEKITVEVTKAKGFSENSITIYEINLLKERHINKFLYNLSKNLDKESKELLISQAETRLDGNYDFFLRLDKDEFINNKRLMVTDLGNCFHIKVSIAAFPKNRQNALQAVKNIFNG